MIFKMKCSARCKRGFVGHSLSHPRKHFFMLSFMFMDRTQNLPSFIIYHHTGKSIHLNTQNRNCLKCVLSHFPNGWLGYVFTPLFINLRLVNRAKFVISRTHQFTRKTPQDKTRQHLLKKKKLATKITTSLIKTTNFLCQGLFRNKQTNSFHFLFQTCCLLAQ